LTIDKVERQFGNFLTIGDLQFTLPINSMVSGLKKHTSPLSTVNCQLSICFSMIVCIEIKKEWKYFMGFQLVNKVLVLFIEHCKQTVKFFL
jgi:hypothetical protein